MRASPHLVKLRAQVREEALPWLDDMAARNLSSGTLQAAEEALTRLLQFLAARGGPGRLRDVSQADLEAWRAAMFDAKRSPYTITSLLEWAERFYRWMERRGLMFQSPAENLERIRFVRPLLPVPSEKDMNRLLTDIPQRAPVDLRDRALLETAYASGLRMAELASLDVGAVDLENATVRAVGKGQLERVVPLTRAALAALRLYLEHARPMLIRGKSNQPALWVAFKGGRRMGIGALHATLKERAQDVGLDLSMHSVRRAFATHLLHHGASPMELKSLLGHRSFRHLRHYLRYAPMELLQTHRRSRLSR